MIASNIGSRSSNTSHKHLTHLNSNFINPSPLSYIYIYIYISLLNLTLVSYILSFTYLLFFFYFSFYLKWSVLIKCTNRLLNGAIFSLSLSRSHKASNLKFLNAPACSLHQ